MAELAASAPNVTRCVASAEPARIAASKSRPDVTPGYLLEWQDSRAELGAIAQLGLAPKPLRPHPANPLALCTSGSIPEFP